MFAHGIAFVHFYNAEHVVSAIAKFLANILGEGEKWDKMGDGRRRERVGEKGEGMEGKGRVWRSGQWECTKNISLYLAPKQHICHLKTPLGSPVS